MKLFQQNSSKLVAVLIKHYLAEIIVKIAFEHSNKCPTRDMYTVSPLLHIYKHHNESTAIRD